MLDNYEADKNGIIKQIKFSKIQYNNEYVEQRYNSYPTGEAMAYLRLGYLLGVLKDFTPGSILDVGYGNGDFLKIASKCIEKCSGSDIPPSYPLPNHIDQVNDIYEKAYDVVCFFDSLEHFDDIYEIKKIQARYVYISVPWCHYVSDDWFDEWKHRRPDEHLWHFDLDSLRRFFRSMGYEYISHSAVEDTIRKPSSDLANILTAVFKKK
jgi:hypothetical protein